MRTAIWLLFFSQARGMTADDSFATVLCTVLTLFALMVCVSLDLNDLKRILKAKKK